MRIADIDHRSVPGARGNPAVLSIRDTNFRGRGVVYVRETTAMSPAVGRAEIDPRQWPALRRYRSWPRFRHGIRRRRVPLLRSLARYEDAVLIAGCQRSGTTMLTRIIARSAGFRGLALTTDDELDAALALCGEIDLPARTRYCLQTTYLNECYPEYRGLGPGQRLVWVVRNPYSVVYSMVYNWRRFALNELFVACGQASAPDGRMRRIDLPWPVGPSAIERACLSYSGKTRQIEEILQFLPPDRVMVVDYDALVLEPRAWLEQIFAFVGEPYDESYARAVQPDSARKAERLSANAAALVAEVAEPTYRSCLRLCTRPRSP